MIDINLIPSHLRKTRREKKLPIYLNIPKEAIIGLVGGLFVLLFLVHIVFQVIIFVKFSHHAYHKKQMNAIASDKTIVDGILDELRGLQKKKSSVEKVTTEKRISWSRKLNDISDSLPRGVWLTRVYVDENVLIIEGSVVSKAKEEVINVGNFTTQLKNHPSFMIGLKNVEMGSVQSRMIKTVEIADFIITAKLK